MTKRKFKPLADDLMFEQLQWRLNIAVKRDDEAGVQVWEAARNYMEHQRLWRLSNEEKQKTLVSLVKDAPILFIKLRGD
jgi:hypothetical protein